MIKTKNNKNNNNLDKYYKLNYKLHPDFTSFFSLMPIFFPRFSLALDHYVCLVSSQSGTATQSLSFLTLLLKSIDQLFCNISFSMGLYDALP